MGVLVLFWWDPVRDQPRFPSLDARYEALPAEELELLKEMEASGYSVP